MPVTLKALGLMLSCVLFAPASAGASDPTPEKPKPEASIKRQELRYDGKSFDEWRRSLLTELKPERRVEALKALRVFAGKGYGAEAAEAAVAVMADYEFYVLLPAAEGEEVAGAAADVMDKVGTAAQPALLRALKGQIKNQCLFALWWLKWRGVGLGFALPALENLVLNKDTDIQGGALDVLVSRSSDKGALAVLSRSAKQRDVEIRRATLSQIAALREAPESPESLVRLILSAFGDKEDRVRLEAVDALRAIVYPPYFRQETLQARAAELLELTRDRLKAVPDLVAILKDSSPKVRERAIEVLAPFIPHSTQIARAIGDACKAPDPGVRKAAIIALEKAERPPESPEPPKARE